MDISPCHTLLKQRIYATYASDSLITHYVKNQEAVRTFWQHEARTNIDVTDSLTNLRRRRMPNLCVIWPVRWALFQ